MRRPIPSLALLAALLFLGPGCDTLTEAPAPMAVQGPAASEFQREKGSFDPALLSSAPDGWLGRFLFDGDARNTAPGNRFRCEPGGAELTTDRFGNPGKAALLEPGDLIDCGDVFDDIGLPYTVALWARPATIAGNQTMFMTDYNASGPYYGLRIKIVNGKLETFYGNGTVAGVSGRRGTTSTADLTAGEWMHLAAVVVSPDEMVLYVNGEAVASTINGTGGAYVSNPGPTVFGAGTTDAALDDLYLFSSALPASSIARLAADAP